MLFSFLARKTDFYTGGGEGAAEKLLIEKFQSHEKTAADLAVANQKRKLKEEEKLMEKRAKEKAREDELFRDRPHVSVEEEKIKELTNEEAEELGKKLEKVLSSLVLRRPSI